MRRTIVCGVDESPAAADAVHIAAALSASLKLDLVLLHAVSVEPAVALAAAPHYRVAEDDFEVRRESARTLLERRAGEAGVTGSADLRVEPGHASQVLSSVAEHEDAALVVVGTRGRRPLVGVLLGSVSTAVVSRAPCPVVVVPEGARFERGPIVCAVDDSPAARAASRVARQLSLALEGALVLVHVVSATPPPTASAAPGARGRLQQAERAEAERFLMSLVAEEDLGPDVARDVAVGSEADAIRDVADREGAALIVIGTRRLGAFRASLVGSVSFDLRTSAIRPVLVVPADARVPLQRWASGLR